MDLAIQRIPHSKEITGIRISDKTRGDLLIRLEIWVTYPNAEFDSRGKAIMAFVYKEYLEKYGLPTYDIIKCDNHKH